MFQTSCNWLRHVEESLVDRVLVEMVLVLRECNKKSNKKMDREVGLPVFWGFIEECFPFEDLLFGVSSFPK